jgi:hypothetical protein
VSLHRKGPRKMVSLRRHGGSDGTSDRPFASRPERRAGRVCAAHKGDGTGGCVGVVRRKESSPGSSIPVRFAKACGRMQKRRCSLSETGENHPLSRPLQRDRSRGQKPPNGAPEGVIPNTFDAAPPAPRPNALSQTHGRNPPRGYARMKMIDFPQNRFTATLQICPERYYPGEDR